MFDLRSRWDRCRPDGTPGGWFWDPKMGGSGGVQKGGGGGFLINTFLGVIEQLPRTNGVFLGSFLAFFGLFGTPPKNPVF
jgi:hypothetical protein